MLLLRGVSAGWGKIVFVNSAIVRIIFCIWQYIKTIEIVKIENNNS